MAVDTSWTTDLSKYLLGIPQDFGQKTYKTSFLDPELARSLASSLGGVASQAAQQYMPTLENVTQNPLFQSQLSGILEALVPSEQKARMNLADTFRAAGNTGSSVYGNNAQNLESDILGNRRQAASQLVGQSFAQLMQALQQPLSQIDSLIKALRVEEGSGKMVGGGGGGGKSGWESIPPSQGLNTPMSNMSTGMRAFSGGSPGYVSGSYGPTSSWQAQDEAYRAQLQSEADRLMSQYSQNYGDLGSTMFMPGGQYMRNWSGWDTPTDYASTGGEY